MEVENSTESEPFTIDYNTRWQLIGYYECCLNQKQTAEHFGIHQSSVSRILSKKQDVNLLENGISCKIMLQVTAENNIATLQHPPNSVDLNPIELVWSILKRLVEKSQPKNEESLSICIVSCWDSIPQSQIKSCIEHFQRRVDQVFSLNWSFY